MSETAAIKTGYETEDILASNEEQFYTLLRAQTASRILGSLCVGRTADKQFVKQAVDLADALILRLKETK